MSGSGAASAVPGPAIRKSSMRERDKIGCCSSVCAASKPLSDDAHASGVAPAVRLPARNYSTTTLTGASLPNAAAGGSGGSGGSVGTPSASPLSSPVIGTGSGANKRKLALALAPASNGSTRSAATASPSPPAAAANGRHPLSPTAGGSGGGSGGANRSRCVCPRWTLAAITIGFIISISAAFMHILIAFPGAFAATADDIAAARTAAAAAARPNPSATNFEVFFSVAAAIARAVPTQYRVIALFAVCGSMCLFSFLSVMLSDPGTVPAYFKTEKSLTALDVVVTRIETKRNGQPRYCRKCKAWKPDRAHHCRTCGCCVLKMDHHCGFMNNCIGYQNHKAFVCFLIWTWLSCLVMCSALYSSQRASFVWRNGMIMFRGVPWSVVLELMIVVVFAFAVGVVISGFLSFHLFLAATNYTTLEFMEKRRWSCCRALRCQSSSAAGGYVNYYNRGLWTNTIELFGSNPLLALWPVHINPYAPPRGDGVSWTINSLYTPPAAGAPADRSAAPASPSSQPNGRHKTS